MLLYNHSKGNRAESTGQEVREMEIDSMTQTELASYIETLAKLVEATAKDAQDAARIIREAIPSNTTGRERQEPQGDRRMEVTPA